MDAWCTGYPGNIADVFHIPDSRNHIFIAGGDLTAVQELMRQYLPQEAGPLGGVRYIEPISAKDANIIWSHWLDFLAIERRPLLVWVKIKRHNVYQGDKGLLHVIKPADTTKPTNRAPPMMAKVIILPRLPPLPNDHTMHGPNQ
jgi:hypothetical protein